LGVEQAGLPVKNCVSLHATPMNPDHKATRGLEEINSKTRTGDSKHGSDAVNVMFRGGKQISATQYLDAVFN
jgi:hypothetical protein